jgi:hypothetical protein
MSTRWDSADNGARELTVRGSFPLELGPSGRLPKRVARTKAGMRFPASVGQLSVLVRASEVTVTKCPPGIPFTGIPRWA